MAWTQTEYDTLKAAVAAGVRVVRYADKTVEYHDLAAMRALLAEMEGELNPTDPAGCRTSLQTFSAD